MDYRSFTALILGIGCLVIGTPSRADEIRISGSRCSNEVHVVARDARLSAVLKQLAEVLDFKLRVDSDNDPLVDIDAVRRPRDLIMRLAPLENVSMTQGRDPKCRNQPRILQVWVLPMARNGVARAMASTPNALTPQQQAEQERLAHEGANMILKAHGMDPAGQSSSQ